MSTCIEVPLNRRQQIIWPLVCACCGEHADTKVEIEYKIPQPSVDLVFRHQVPACNICSIHSVRKKTGIWVLLFGLLLVLGLVFSLGINYERNLWGIPFFILWFAADTFLLIKLLQMDAGRKARETMKPACSAKSFVSFYVLARFRFFTDPPTSHFFLFANDSYARAFADLNHGVETKRYGGEILP